jgi:phosphate:Na+ symporter
MISVAITAAGGLAMFLLAMSMMTDGLKTAAGDQLRVLLARWTATPIRGLVTGLLVTGLMQSSSAVTVATIGFVNAGVLTLRQALGVVLGASVGTTATGWLVSLVGAGFKIDALAMPMLALGVLLRLAARPRRLQGLGGALAGFGLFFLGVGILRDAFGALASSAGGELSGVAAGGWPVALAGGALITVLTQSSSASVAIILTAATGGVIDLPLAAAAVVGASLGTTSTGALAALNATPSARRLALGHVVVNTVAAGVALALLPVLLWLLGAAATRFDLDRSPATILALFHTTFTVLGVALMLPFSGSLAAWLERRFRSADEDLGRPQFLDDTLHGMPALAISALHAELARMRTAVHDLTRAAIVASGPVDGRAAAVRTLGSAVAEFVTRARTEAMTEEAGEGLARALRIERYLDEAARLTPQLAQLRRQTDRLDDGPARARLDAALAAATACLALAGKPVDEPGNDLERRAALEAFEAEYQRAKAGILTATVEGRFTADEADRLLDALSDSRRLVEQLVNADRLLRSPGMGAAIEGER